MQPDVLSTATSGHLWWTRWSAPQEFVILWIETPEGQHTDTWIYPDTLDKELDEWDRGQFRYLGVTYRLTWLEDAETDEMRRALQIEQT